jgi:transcriptional regulator with XRE-family HTH domain
MEDLRLAIGGRIRRLRRARSGPNGKPLSITALAEHASLSSDYLNKLELGHYTPSADTLLALARALDVRLDELVPVSREATKRGATLEGLMASVSRYRASEIEYLVSVIEAIMERPRSSRPPKRG